MGHLAQGVDLVRTSLSGMAILRNSWILYNIYINARIAHVHAALIGTMLYVEVPRRHRRKRHATEAFGHDPSPSSSALVHSIDTREAALAEREHNLQRLENQALAQQKILRDTELVLAGREAELEDRERLLDQTSIVSAGQALLDQIEDYTCPLLVCFLPKLTHCRDMLITSYFVTQMLRSHVGAHIHQFSLFPCIIIISATLIRVSPQWLSLFSCGLQLRTQFLCSLFGEMVLFVCRRL